MFFLFQIVSTALFSGARRHRAASTSAPAPPPTPAPLAPTHASILSDGEGDRALGALGRMSRDERLRSSMEHDLSPALLAFFGLLGGSGSDPTAPAQEGARLQRRELSLQMWMRTALPQLQREAAQRSEKTISDRRPARPGAEGAAYPPLSEASNPKP